jgi:ABC-2 type transport system permease protein
VSAVDTTTAPGGGRARRDEWRRLASLTWTLAFTDWKLRFYGSALGYVWTLARPFAFFGVIYFVFTEVVNLGDQVAHYGVYILLGMVLFGFFGEATSGCVMSLVVRENLLRKIRVPTIVVPLATVVTALLNLGMTLLAVAVFAMANGVHPSWGWLELPVMVALLALFATGVGMLLSVMYVRYRDIQPIWEVVIQALFYATPVLYVVTQVPSQWQGAFLCNPIAAILTQMRHAVIDPTAPTAGEAIGGDVRLLIPLGVIAVRPRGSKGCRTSLAALEHPDVLVHRVCARPKQSWCPGRRRVAYEPLRRHERHAPSTGTHAPVAGLFVEGRVEHESLAIQRLRNRADSALVGLARCVPGDRLPAMCRQ